MFDVDSKFRIIGNQSNQGLFNWCLGYDLIRKTLLVLLFQYTLRFNLSSILYYRKPIARSLLVKQTGYTDMSHFTLFEVLNCSKLVNCISAFFTSRFSSDLLMAQWVLNYSRIESIYCYFHIHQTLIFWKIPSKLGHSFFKQTCSKCQWLTV